MIVRLLLLLLVTLTFSVCVPASSEFLLRENCPPSFEKVEAGTCRLRTLYEAYDSVQGAGLGGRSTDL